MVTDGEVRAAAKQVIREFKRTQRQALRQPASVFQGWMVSRDAAHDQAIGRLMILISEDDLSSMSDVCELHRIQGAMLAFGDDPAIADARTGEISGSISRRCRRSAQPVYAETLVASIRSRGEDMLDSASRTAAWSQDTKKQERRLVTAELIVTLIGVRLATNRGETDQNVLGALRTVAQALIANA